MVGIDIAFLHTCSSSWQAIHSIEYKDTKQSLENAVNIFTCSVLTVSIRQGI